MTLVVPAIIVAAGVVIASRALFFRYRSDESLLDQARPDLVERLSEFSFHVDGEKLMRAIGGWRGVLDISRACGAIGTLICRHARRTGGKPSPLAEQMFMMAVAARILAMLTLPELWVRSYVPPWPPVFGAALARLFCEMAFTLDAMAIQP